MVKKQFIDKKNAKTYRLVHRSQRDPLINDENAPKLVLQEVTTGHYLQDSFEPKALEPMSDEEEEEEDWRNDPSNYGVYFQDDYDYLQHLKPVGEDPTATLISAEQEAPKKGIQFKDSDARKQLDQLPAEVFASKDELSVGLMNQENGPGLQLDLDPAVREAFVALDDEAYVEDLDDDFFDAFHQEELPEKYAAIEAQVPDSEEDEDDEDWMKAFKKFRKAKEYVASDDDVSETEIGNYIQRRATSTNFSMSSSALFRNDKLTLLDNQFDKILEEYSDEEIGELASDDEELKGTYDVNSKNEHLEELFDSFLENLQLMGQRRRVVERKREENLDAIRNELKDQARSLLDKYAVVEPIKEMPIVMPEPKKRNQWDAETILTTNSNIYNRPAIIKEISTGVPKIRLQKGMPKVVEEEDSESEEESEEEKGSQLLTIVNKGVKRNPQESAEEKRLRKEAVKKEKKERREAKKATKEAFGAEKNRQAKLVPNMKLQSHSVQL